MIEHDAAALTAKTVCAVQSERVAKASPMP